MYLHNFKQWVEGRERMKGKLRLNFTAADWVVCWMHLPEITGVIGKWKPKYLTFGAIWCIRWSWKGNSLVFSQSGICIRVVWIIFGPLSISSGSTEQLSTDTNLFRHLCTAGNTCTWVHRLGAGSVPGNSLQKVEGCVFSVCPAHTPVAPNQTHEWRPPDPARRACPGLPPDRANKSHTWSWWHWRVPLPATGLLHVFLTLQCKGMPWANIFCNMHVLHWDSVFVYSSKLLCLAVSSCFPAVASVWLC